MLKTKERAKGKWEGLLRELIGPHAVKRTHGPCPICGGTDRYRFDNNRNDGDWYCNGCGSGDGFKLLQRALEIDFVEAAKLVDQLVGKVEEKPFIEEINIEQRRSIMNQIWAESDDEMVWKKYLWNRGISSKCLDQVQDVRGHKALDYRDGDSVTRYPAMVAVIRNEKGIPVSLHRTYLGLPDGKHKKIMPTLDTIAGGYIRLASVENSLIIAEGIETALSMMTITGVPAWSCISAHNLEIFNSVPKSVERLIICADNDKTFVGQAAAFKCASRMKVRRNIQFVTVLMPSRPGTDMNDWLRDGKPKVVDSAAASGTISQIGLHQWMA